MRSEGGNVLTELRSGSATTTQVGYLNRNKQRNHGTIGLAGTDHMQLAYKMICEQDGCGHEYGANGSDIFQRKCPRCQSGAEGIVWE
ncbi:hypothetical protein BGP75_00995 [Motiliproteus sp. MSK22-1]|nr:hypothetical protein BGP75_00995 [Motiliproteus sp. MSK22-1]